MAQNITLGALEFRAEDFEGVNMAEDRGREVYTCYGPEPFQCERLAAAANALLRERLAKVPVVYSHSDIAFWNRHVADASEYYARARLVCIEENKLT